MLCDPSSRVHDRRGHSTPRHQHRRLTPSRVQRGAVDRASQRQFSLTQVPASGAISDSASCTRRRTYRRGLAALRPGARAGQGGRLWKWGPSGGDCPSSPAHTTVWATQLSRLDFGRALFTRRLLGVDDRAAGRHGRSRRGRALGLIQRHRPATHPRRGSVLPRRSSRGHPNAKLSQNEVRPKAFCAIRSCCEAM